MPKSPSSPEDPSIDSSPPSGPARGAPRSARTPGGRAAAGSSPPRAGSTAERTPSRPPRRSVGKRLRGRLGLLLGLLAVLVTGITALLIATKAEVEEELPADEVEYPEYVETGGLEEIADRGFLRILMPPQRPRVEERVEFPIEIDRQVAVNFAEGLGLQPVIEYLPDRRQLLEALKEGRTDLVVARLRPTPELAEDFDFSVAIDHVREMVVTAEGSPIDDPSDLDGARIAVQESAPYFASLENLQRDVPGLEIVPVSEELTEEEIADLVAGGEFDATVMDEDLLTILEGEREDIRGAFALTQNRPVAWALREGSDSLKEAIDLHLQQSVLTADLGNTVTGDLDAIKERGVLRVLTRNNPVTYFLYRGEQMGFEFELTRRLARKLGVRLQIIVPEEPGQLPRWLLEGKGDLIAASMTVTPERERVLDFTVPYNRTSELLVARPDEIPGLDAPRDLDGRRIHVQRSSSYYPRLRELQRGAGFEIVEVPEDLEATDLVTGVAEETFDLTVVDGNMLDVELTWREDVDSAFPLGDPWDIAWAVRPGDDDLLEAANSFLEGMKGTTTFNVLRQKYFSDRDTIARRLSARPTKPGELSPYDELFQQYGREREFDWRLIASQSYQESRFDPLAKSWAGAVGLMQLMPPTAREMGVRRTSSLRDPETSIRYGTLYLRKLFDIWDSSIPFAERVRLALASYNAGRGHIIDGRTLARQMGKDPDLWYDNVAEVLPLLARRSYARRARHGYCRCGEPVIYVRNIDARYFAYVQLLEPLAVP